MTDTHTLVVSGAAEAAAHFAPLLALPGVDVRVAPQHRGLEPLGVAAGTDPGAVLHHVILMEQSSWPAWTRRTAGFALMHHVADRTLPGMPVVGGTVPRIVLIEQRLVDVPLVKPRLVEPLRRLGTPGCNTVREPLHVREIRRRYAYAEPLAAPLAITFAGTRDAQETASDLRELADALAHLRVPRHLVCRGDTAGALGADADDWHRMTVIRTT